MGAPLMRLLFRKMWNTKWLTISTLLGLIVAVSFTVSIPMYSDGALKRVVSTTLVANSEGLPAGSLLMSYQAPGGTKTDSNALEAVTKYISEEVPQEITFPFDTYVNTRSLRASEIYPEDPTKVDASRTRTMSLLSMNNLKDHITITNGKLYNDAPQDNVIEAMMLEEAMYRQDLHVGDIINYPIASGLDITLKVKIVGVFQSKIDNDVYWYQGFEVMMNNLYVSEKVFNEYLLKQLQIPVHSSSWYYAFDLREIKTSQLTPLSNTLDRLNVELYQKLKDTKVDISFGNLLEDFRKQSLQMQTLLFTLAAPMIAMVFYYIVMNARQALDKQKSDIAVLRSRGASTNQIVFIYLLEGIILGVVAMILGPLLGFFMSKSIGSANGFLTFVDRKSIPVGFNMDAILLGLGAVVIAILATLLPAISYARASIVNAKQKQARSDGKPFWQRWFIDIVLLALSGYGFYMFNERQMLTFQTGMTTDELQVQPFLFFVPAIAIFSLGLFFLRLFPLILKFIGWLGKRWLPVPYYLSLTQLSRSSTSYYPLMILLVLTLGLGVYNASAARTIDLNSTERTLYKYGSDVIVKTVWDSVAETPKPNQNNQGGSGNGGQGGGGQPSNPGGGQGPGGNPGQQPNNQPTKLIYSEPPFEVFRRLEGVEAAARVLQTKGNIIVSGRSAGQGIMMGIDNVDFSKVAWFRNDLFPAHPFQYLNLLGMNESAALVPQTLADKYKLKPGDVFQVSIGEQSLDFAVYGIIPYWPTQYPDKTPFIIANLDYIYDQVPLIPYEVWLKMKDGAKVAPIVTKLADQGIEIASIDDVRSELVSQNKHPTRGGVFGILSLGFLVSVIISLIGYILYWFFNLSGRVVQFGILRAMGLSKRQLTYMLLAEQILTAGLAIVLGIVIGKVVGRFYLPFLQTADNVTTQVPPFRIVFDSQDTLQLYAVVFVMLILGAGLLFWQIRRLRVHQAVKMGEER